MNRHCTFGGSLLLAAALAWATAGCTDNDDEETTVGAGGAGGSAGMGGTAGTAGTGGTGPSGDILGAEVLDYDISFDLTSAAARSVLTLQVPAPGGDCLSVPCELPVSGVMWNGQPATEQLADGVTLRACGAGVAAAEPLALAAQTVVPELTFHNLDVGFSRSQSLAGGTFSYLLSWVGGCDHFGPCDDHPGRLSTFHFSVTHPPGVTVLCPGQLFAGNELTTCELSQTLAPTYSAYAIAADPTWIRTPWSTVSGVDLVFYETPGGNLAASVDLAQVTAFFEWLTSLLGPYPYGSELRFAAGPTAWLGFEHPGNIILHQQLQNLNLSYADGLHHVLIHEVIHQWAGNRVTLAEATDFVWKEAICEYLTYVFEDEHLSGGEAAASLSYWDQIAQFAEYHPRPTDEPAPAVHEFYGDAYGPGPMVLFVQLETMLGRTAILDGIRSFLAEPAVRSVVDLQQALEEAAAVGLDDYFAAWVYGSGVPHWPQFAVDAQQAGDQVTVTVTQQSGDGTLFGCQLDVLVQGASGGTAVATVDFGLAPSSAVQSAVVTLAEPVQSITVDPDHRVVNLPLGGVAAGIKPQIWIF